MAIRTETEETSRIVWDSHTFIVSDIPCSCGEEGCEARLVTVGGEDNDGYVLNFMKGGLSRNKIILTRAQLDELIIDLDQIKRDQMGKDEGDAEV